MCGSKKPAQTTTSTAPPPEVMEAYRRVMARAEPLADTPYEAYGGERVADFTPDQLQAFQGVRDAQGTFQPYLDQATGYATLGASPIDAASIQRYQNPYQQQVIDATMADFNTQNARQLSEVRGSAAARGALGGNRVAVAESLAQEQQNRTQSPIIANLRSQGWNSALSAAQADRAAAGQGAYTFGSLGGQALSSSLTGANALYGMGGNQQALDQANLNVPYQNFQEQRAYPFQTTSWLSGIMSGLGSQMGGTSTSTSPAPSMWNSLLGGAATLGGGYLASGGRFGFADGGAVLPGFADGGPVMPYGGGFIPMVPIARGQGVPRGAPATPVQSNDAAGNALQNLASMSRRRPGAAPETLAGWETTVEPAMDGMAFGGVVPRGYDDGGVVAPPYVMPEWAVDQSPIENYLPREAYADPNNGTGNPQMPFFLDHGNTTPDIPQHFVRGNANLGQVIAPDGPPQNSGSTLGAAVPFLDVDSADGVGRLPGVAAGPQGFSGPVVNPRPMQSFTGAANPSGADLNVVAPARPNAPTGVAGLPPRPSPPNPVARMNLAPSYRPPATLGSPIGPPQSGAPATGGGAGGGSSPAPADSGMRNIGLALMMAGLRTMASPSPYLGVAIGEGGQTGVQTYMQLDEAQHRRRLSQEQVNLQARRLEEQARHNRAGEGAGRYQFLPLGPGEGTLRANSRTGEYNTIPVQLAPRGALGQNPSRVREAEWMVSQGIAPDVTTAHTLLRTSVGAGGQYSRIIESIAARLAREEFEGTRQRSTPAAREAEARQIAMDRRRLNPDAYAGDPGNGGPGAAPAAPAAAAPAAQAAPPPPSAIAGQTGPGRWGWSVSRQRWVHPTNPITYDRLGNPVQ